MKRLLMGGVAVLSCTGSGCAREDGGPLYKKAPVQIQDQTGQRGDFALTMASYKSFTWYIPCTDADPAPTPGPRELVVKGPGPHHISRERLVGTPVFFAGRLCAPKNYARDLVIAVDASGSMSWNDPRRADGGCQRLDAVNAILGAAPQGSKLALFMFEEEIQQQSDTFFDDAGALERKVSNISTSFADVICQRGGGETDFSLMMATAKSYLAKGRGNAAKKELYVISDGMNNETDVPAAAGIQTATDIKNTGITIGSEQIKTTIAALEIPKDNGAADMVLHKLVTGPTFLGPVSAPQVISAAVGQLAVNLIDSATLDYRVTGAPSGTAMDVKAQLSNMDFTLPQQTLSIDGRQAGWDLKLNAVDTDGTRETFAGTIIWDD